MHEPVRTQKSAFTFKLYSALKKGGTPLNYIDEFFKNKGYRNKTQFLRTMERLGVAPAGSAEKAFANIPSDPRVGGVSQPDVNDDDKMYTHFKPRMSVMVNILSKMTDLFRSEEHKRLYSKLLKQGVINPRSVDFDFLDSLNVKLERNSLYFSLNDFVLRQQRLIQNLLPISILI